MGDNLEKRVTTSQNRVGVVTRGFGVKGDKGDNFLGVVTRVVTHRKPLQILASRALG